MGVRQYGIQYRKAARTVDEWPESVAGSYKAQGEMGLLELLNVVKRIVGRIARWLREEELDKGRCCRQVAPPVRDKSKEAGL